MLVEKNMDIVQQKAEDLPEISLNSESISAPTVTPSTDPLTIDLGDIQLG